MKNAKMANYSVSILLETIEKIRGWLDVMEHTASVMDAAKLDQIAIEDQGCLDRGFGNLALWFTSLHEEISERLRASPKRAEMAAETLLKKNGIEFVCPSCRRRSAVGFAELETQIVACSTCGTQCRVDAVSSVIEQVAVSLQSTPCAKITLAVGSIASR